MGACKTEARKKTRRRAWVSKGQRGLCRADSTDLLDGSGHSSARRGDDGFFDSFGAGGTLQKLVRQETCAVRQDALSKVHHNFVTAKMRFRGSPPPKKRTVNAAQIIYISAALVTQKDVTVGPQERRLQATCPTRKGAPHMTLSETACFIGEQRRDDRRKFPKRRSCDAM
jgi:hypothetical protein